MTYLSIYKLIFTTELLVAEFLFVSKLPKRKGFWWRVITYILTSYIFALVYPTFGANNWLTSSLMFFLLFLVTIFGMFLCYKTSFINILFCGIIAYTTQHLSCSLFRFVNVVLLDSKGFISVAYGSDRVNLTNIDGIMGFSIVAYIAIYFIAYLLTYVSLNNITNKEYNLKFNSGSIVMFVLSSLLINIVISAVYEYELAQKPFISSVVVYLLSIVFCVTIFFMYNNIIKTRYIENEMQVISQLFRQSQKQYRFQTESINLINQKCHDLKYQIRHIGDENEIDKAVVDEIENLISIYDTNIITGHKVLDIILSEKSLIALKSGITLTCYVDGLHMKFMENSDIYALFGNIIDNAIEAVSNVTVANKRCINLHVDNQSGFVHIRCDNYFKGSLRFNENGLPFSSKEDKNYHGYGIKSIHAITNKYGGKFDIKIDNDVFMIDLVFPIMSNSQDAV